jgi:hypothetical protein
MSVANPVAENRAAATHFANLCHKTGISLVRRSVIVPIWLALPQGKAPVGQAIVVCGLSVWMPIEANDRDKNDRLSHFRAGAAATASPEMP